MTRKSPRATTIAIIAALLTTSLVQADPEIQQESDAAVFVQGASDYFEFAPGNSVSFGTSWILTSPSGDTMEIVRSVVANSPSGLTSFYLDGTPRSNSDEWTVNANNLDNTAADGTWTIRLSPTAYASVDGSPSATTNPAATLSVQGKKITFGASYVAPDTHLQFWNWHQTVVNWSEPSTVSNTPTGTPDPNFQDPLDEAVDEDPNEARFFVGPDTPPPPGFTDDDPRAVTGGFTVDCGTEEVTVNGAWFRGATQTENTYAQFAYQDGQVDPTEAVMGSLTTNTDVGAALNGTHEDSFPYDNPLGNSYQFITRNGSTGAAVRGFTFQVPAEQCNDVIPTIGGGLSLATANIRFTISQAQCNEDPVGFTIVEDLGNSLIGGGWEVIIIRDSDDAVIETIPESQWHTTVDGFYWIQDEYAPGAYTAAFLGESILGLIRLVDAVAFNVPEGTCKDEPVTVDVGNVTVELDQFTLTEILNVTTDTNNGSILLGNLSFEELGFDGFLILLISFILLIWSTMRTLNHTPVWFLVPVMAFLGVLTAALGPDLPADLHIPLRYLLVGAGSWVFIIIIAKRFGFNKQKSTEEE